MQEPRTVSEVLTIRARQQCDEPLYIQLEHGERPLAPVSYGALRERAALLAAHLVTVTDPGDRVLLLFPGTPDFMVALFACFYAGLIAVPAPPLSKLRVRRTLPRLLAMVRNAQPTHAIASPSMYDDARELFELAPELAALSWIPLQGPPQSWSFALPALDEAALVTVAPDDLAYLQYTSGSTTDPKGVAVTHANLMAGCALMEKALEVTPADVAVSWLPNFHDMGLVNGLLQPLYSGYLTYIMDPVEFVQRPARWLEAFSRYRATFGGAPNMAYELLLNRVSDAEREGLDLSSIRNLYNAAEPIRPGIVAEIAQRYSDNGLSPQALSASFGLAEATLMVTAHGPVQVGGIAELAIDELLFARSGRMQIAEPGCRAKIMPSSGPPLTSMTIVDPLTRRRCADGVEGEVWVNGPMVTAGYFRNDEATEETFRAFLENGEGPFLRTGDLAFMHEGQLYVSGRIKDVIIVAGANHYPQDIELTLGRAHPAVRAGCCAAFSLPQDAGEAVVVVVELRKRYLPGSPQAADLSEVVAAIREAVSAAHEISLEGIALIKPGTLFKTSSGKIQRRKTRDGWLDQTSLEEIHRWSRAAAPAPAAVPAASIASGREITQWLQRSVARIMGLADPAQIGLDEPFQRLGLSSLNGVALAAELGRWLDRELPATLLWAHPTIAQLVRFVAAPQPVAQDRHADRAALIAIVGIGCRFPGADGKERYWQLLHDGVDAISEVPKDRFDAEALYDGDPAAPGKLNTRFGGFLDRPDEFDAGFFGISPREAACMDPQQRVVLEVAWDAIDDAGIDVERLAGSRTGVFVGATSFDYGHLQMSRPELVDGYMGTGTTLCIVANRISYLYDLRGPSMVVDTACSSSLMSVHMACESLRRGEVNLALAGGVNLIFSPILTINATKLNNMAKDGRCKTFDARADGAVRSEGAGMVVLKPLERAVADGDRIYAVLRSTASNQDGRSNGLMAPNPEAQREVLTDAYRRAGIEPWQVQYVEAHGTGTLLGDPIEARALGELLRVDRPADAPVTAIGSVKSNIGHTESSAGIAGLIKVALSLHHQQLPASLHFDSPNPHIPFDELPLRVVTEREPWPGSQARYAGVSAFGWGGTNVHAVLSGAPDVAPANEQNSADPSAREPQLFVTSARCQAGLRAIVRAYRERFDAGHEPLNALLRASAARRTHHPYRLAAVAHDRRELISNLDSWLAGDSEAAAEGLVSPGSAGRRIVFVYPGSGWQWPKMAREWLASSSTFATSLKRCDEVMADLLAVPPSQRLLSEGDWLERTEDVQPVLFAVQIALTELWRSWGVLPSAIVGHSMGEPAAAWACGALTLRDAAVVAVRRAAKLQELSGKGGMLLAELSADEAVARVAHAPERLAVAVCNSPRQTVIAGELAALEKLLGQLQAEGVFCRRIQADGAGHSHYVDPLAAALKQELSGRLASGLSSVAYYSPVVGGLLERPVFDAAYWASNLRQTVQFAAATRQLLDHGYDTFIEMSAHPVLCQAIERTAAAMEKRPLVLASGRREQDMRATSLAAAAKLYVAGQPLDYQQIMPPGAPAELPRYPWQRQRYWFDDGAPEAGRGRAGGHLWLASHVQPAHQQGVHLWELAIAPSLSPWLRDHALRTTVLVPGVSLLQLAATALTEASNLSTLGFRHVRFARPLSVPDEGVAYGQLLIEPASAGHQRFVVYASQEGDWPLCAEGEIFLEDGAPEPAQLRIDTIEARCAERISATEHYDQLRASGVSYGPAFRGLASLRIGNGEVLAALVGNSAIHGERRFDACLHAAMALAGGGALPVAIERVRLWGPLSEVIWSYAHLQDDGRVEVLCSDARGKVLLQVQGLVLQPLAQERHDASNVLYAMDWTVPTASDEAKPRPRGAARVLLIANESDEIATLKERLLASEQERLPELATLSLAAFAADPSRALLAACPDGCDIVAYCGALQCDNEELRAALDLSMGHVVKLVQALVASPWRQHPRLVLVTRGAVALTGSEDASLQIAAAPCWGLARTIRHEHPEFACSCIDIGDGTGAIAALAQQLLSGDCEQEVAYDRRGRRHVLRLQRYQASARRIELPLAQSPHQLVNHTPGALDGLGLQRSERTRLAPGQVRIETRAAALNFRDVMKALAVDIGAQADDAVALGDECSGVIVEVAADVSEFSVGDDVVALAPRALASHVVADARLSAHKPAALSYQQAAAIPIARLTAHLALDELARVRAGESVLIHSAAGGVGLAAVALCLKRGAVVYATAGTIEKRKMLESLGVRAAFHSRNEQWVDAVRDATDGDGVDIVLNSLAGAAIELGLSLLRPGGRFLEIGRRDIAADRPLGMAALTRNVAVIGVDLLSLIDDQPERVGKWLRQLCAQAADEPSQLTVRSFGLDQAEEAFRHMARGEHVGKLVLRFAEPSDLSVAQPAIVADGSYLVTGGLGGIGLALARWLVDRGARHLALVSRSRPSASVQQTLAELAKGGVEIRVLQADVAIAEHVARALTALSDMPPLAGVFHAAVALADSTLLHMTDQQIAQVSAAKVMGAYQLHRATRDLQLTHFCMFSSAASVLGSSGQGNYAGANAYLDALAHARHALGLPALSVSWGTWAQVGGAAQAGHDERLASRGMDALKPEDAFQLLEQLMLSNATHVMCSPMRWRHYFQSQPQLASLPFFADVQDGTEPAADSGSLRQNWLAAPTAEARKHIMQAALCAHIGRVLRVPANRLGSDVALSTLGFDSLTALELRNRLEADIGLQLSATLVWNFPTVGALSANLVDKLDQAVLKSAAGGDRQIADSGAIAAPAAANDASAQLSEAERLLEAKLNALEERLR